MAEGSWGPNRKAGRIVGVMGLGRKTGATHFTLWAASYLSGVRQRKTALMEGNNHGDLKRLEKAWFPAEKRGNVFQALGMDFYKRGEAGELARCLEAKYDEVLIDFGERVKETQNEWQRCDVRIATVSFSDWQLEAAGGMADLRRALGRGWVCLSVFGSEDARGEAQRRLGIPVIRIPFSEDPFHVDRRAMEWFEGVL